MSGVQGGGFTPATIPIEYTRGTGGFVPGAASGASVSGEVAAGNDAVTVTPSGTSGTSDVAVTGAAGVGTTFPATPIDGQLFFLTTSAKLFVWSADAGQWLAAA